MTRLQRECIHFNFVILSILYEYTCMGRDNMAKRKPNQLESNTPDSSMNALKHGLYARKWINPEEQELYDALFDEYCAYYEPVGAPEYTLIESMAASRVRFYDSMQ